MFDDGATLQEIGNEFGVTRERIRQLVKPHRPPRHLVPRKKVLPPPPTPPEVAAAIRATLDGHPPEPRTVLLEVLEAFHPSPLLASRATKASKVTNEEFLAVWADRLERAASECGEPLSRGAYDEWATERGLPSSQSATLRRWSWAQMCDLAGVEAAGPLVIGPRADRYWDVERCQVILGSFIDDCLRGGHRPTMGWYEQWMPRVRGPSWATLRKRVPDLHALITEVVRYQLSEHFAEALARLDAGEDVDPATYVGTLSTPRPADGQPGS